MTVQELRDLLDAYQEQQWLATNPTGGDDIDSFVAAAHGEKRAWHECAAAAVDALPQLLDIAEAAADLRARAGVAATAQPQWTEPADVLRRIDQALERLGETP